MKTVILFLCISLLTGLVYGQAKNAVIVYKRTHQPAASISLPYEPELITAALDDQLSKKDYTRDNSKGFIVFKNVQLVQSDPRRADLYFKVFRNVMSTTGASMVFLMIAMPDEDITKRTQETHFTKEHAKAYLNDLMPVVEAYNLESLIKQQNETIMQEEIRYNDLVKDGAALNERKNSNEQKLLRNKQEQDLQNEEIERQRQALTYLISQRKS